MDVAALGFVAGSVATWLYRNWKDRWSYRAVALSLEGALIGLEHGKDVRPVLRHLANAFGDSK